MANLFITSVIIFNYFVIFYFITLNVAYILLIVLSFISIRRYMKEGIVFQEQRKIFLSRFYKPISVLAPAYNEETSIINTVKSLLQLRYPEFEIIIINDGSTDRTLEILKKTYQLKTSFRPYQKQVSNKKIKEIYTSSEYPHLVVVDKVNGGKADALNAGINISRYPLVSAIDSDSILESSVMLKLVRPFLDDPHTVAAGGIVRVANGCKIKAGEVVTIDLSHKWLVNIQVVEYLRSFLFGRVGWDRVNALLIISGAFGLFRKDAIIASGGYMHDTVGEDMELIIRIHRVMLEKKKKYRVTFLPEPVCWTEVPESLKILGRQRNRWQRGLIESLLTHKKMLFNPRYGVVGLCAMPFYFLYEMLGPVIEFIGYCFILFSFLFGIVNVSFMVLFLSVTIVFGIVQSVSAIALDELSYGKYPRYSHIWKLFVFSILENFGYRQLHSFWRFKGIIDYLKGEKKWGVMERKGIEKKI